MRTILSTRELPPSLIQAARTRGIALEIVPFIRVFPRMSEDTRTLIERLAAVSGTAVVFTSSQAVGIVADRLAGRLPGPAWRIYTLEGKTGEDAVRRFPGSRVVRGGASAAALAARIAASRDRPREAFFFTGDRHAAALPETLAGAGITLHTGIVYETQLTPARIPGAFDGILFFSPSAVESYFSANAARPEAVFFAVGDTTAAALREKTPNPVVTGEKPGAEELVRTAADYFSHKDATHA